MSFVLSLSALLVFSFDFPEYGFATKRGSLLGFHCNISLYLTIKLLEVTVVVNRHNMNRIELN